MNKPSSRSHRLFLAVEGSFKGFLLIELLLACFILSSFLIFYLQAKHNIQKSQQKINKEAVELERLREILYLAMTEPLSDVLNNANYSWELVGSVNYKIILKNKVLPDLYLIRKN